LRGLPESGTERKGRFEELDRKEKINNKKEKEREQL
jgi:hypothetical protein